MTELLDLTEGENLCYVGPVARRVTGEAALALPSSHPVSRAFVRMHEGIALRPTAAGEWVAVPSWLHGSGAERSVLAKLPVPATWASQKSENLCDRGPCARAVPSRSDAKALRCGLRPQQGCLCAAARSHCVVVCGHIWVDEVLTFLCFVRTYRRERATYRRT